MAKKQLSKSGGGNVGGIKYEESVKSAIRKVERDIPDFYLMRGQAGAFDRETADIYLNVNKKKVAVEVKKDKNAQMGGACYYQFDSRTDRFVFVSDKGEETIDIPTREMIEDALHKKVRELEKFLKFIREFPPTDYHSKVRNLPVTCTKEAWDAAVEAGLLKNLNTNIAFNTDFIAKHYAAKGTHYIQIGKGGLFYLSKNPLNLPVPKLQGECQIEIRVAHHGKRKVKSLGLYVVDGTIRTQARLKTTNKSPWTLDNPEHVRALFHP